MLLIETLQVNNNENQPVDKDNIIDLFGKGWERVLLPRIDGKRSDPIVISPDGNKYRSFTQLSKATRYNHKIQDILRNHEEKVKDLFRMIASRSRIEKSNTTDKPVIDEIILSKLANCRPIQPKIVKLSSAYPEVVIALSKQEDQISDSHHTTTSARVVLDPPEFDIGKAYNTIETSVVASQNIEQDGEIMLDPAPILTHTDELQAFYEDLGEEKEEYPTFSQYLSETIDVYCDNEDDLIMDIQEHEHCDHSYSRDTSMADMLVISEDLDDDLDHIIIE